MDVRCLTILLLTFTTCALAKEPRRDEQVQQAFAGLTPVSEEPNLKPVRESDATLEPPAPAELGVPSWLLGESETHLPGDVTSAFELDRNPAPPTAKLALRGSKAPSSSLAGAIARIERLAMDAATIGGLNDLLDECHAAKKLELTAAESQRMARVEAWALDRRGELKCAAGDEHAGFNDFQAALECDPACWSALHNRGVTLAKYGRSAAALEDFTRALEHNPQLSTAYRNRGELQLRTGQAAQALEDFAAAIAQEPKAAALHALRGEALQQLSRLPEALAAYNKSLTLDPAQPEVLSLRAMAHAARSEYRAAIVDFDAALKLDAECGMAYRDVAWLLATCPDAKYRNLTKAREAARRAEKFCPAEDPRVSEVLALVNGAPHRPHDPQVQRASAIAE